jgi:hypothetical protein
MAGFVQASGSGEGVSFFSVAPFASTEGAAVVTPTYLSFRSSGGWLTGGVLPAVPPGALESVLGLTEDLVKAIVKVKVGSVVNAYLYDSASRTYQALANDIGGAKLSFVDATPGGSRVLFETTEKLSVSGGSQPEPGVPNLYEWDEAAPAGERLSLVGLVPPSGESQCGPSGPACEASASGSVAGPGGGSTGEFYQQDTISTDGSRVFFTDPGTKRVYLRDQIAETTVQVSAGTALWQAATPDGAYVFYTEGSELYRYDVLGQSREKLTSNAEGVFGTLGVSADGSYAYFVAPGDALTTVPTEKNEHGEVAVKGAPNLYAWHEDSEVHTNRIAFVARLLNEDGSDWANEYSSNITEGISGGEKTSRVTPDGKTILFSSKSSLTGYDSGKCTGAACVELFNYDAASAQLDCVSCNPRRIKGAANAFLVAKDEISDLPVPRNAFVTRNLSASGDRVFFNTTESLVADDSNGQTDVYEWEREGTGGGSCPVGASDGNGGCLFLISTGQESGPSLFGDAGADGRDVFFFTRQSLVGQDGDDNVDIYDARENGGLIAQNPSPPPAPCTSEACRGSTGPPPAFSVLASAALSGVGNFVQPSPTTSPKKAIKGPAKCPHHEMRKRGKCVKIKAQKKRSKAKRARDGLVGT